MSDEATARMVDLCRNVEEEVETKHSRDGLSLEHLDTDCLIPVARYLPLLTSDFDCADILHIFRPGQVREEEGEGCTCVQREPSIPIREPNRNDLTVGYTVNQGRQEGHDVLGIDSRLASARGASKQQQAG